MKRKFYLFFFLILVVAIVIVIYFGKTNNPQTVIYGISTEPESLNPFHSQFIDFPLIFTQIFEPLFRFDEDTGNPVPWLIETWERLENNKSYEIVLKKGILFHDGIELTSSDVHDTFLPYFKRDENSADVEPSIVADIIDRVEIQGEYKLIFHLKRIYSPFRNILASPFVSCILSSRAVHSFLNGDEFIPVGTGPFILKEWEKGESILLERNENYWGKQPGFTYLEFQPHKIWKRHDLLIENKIDVTSPVAGNYFRIIKKNDIAIEKNNPLALAFIGFNNESGPFKNIYVRKAALCAIDRKRIVNYINQGNAVPAESPLTPGLLGYSEDYEQEEFNVTKALEYIKRSGIKGEIEVDFGMYSGFFFRGEGVVNTIVKQLGEVGFTVNPAIFEDWNTYNEAVRSGDIDIFFDGINNVILDPDWILSSIFLTDSPDNVLHYSNSEVDELLVRGVNSFDIKERESIYGRIQEILLRDTPCIFFHYSSPYFGVLPRIKNFKVTPLSLPDFRETYIQ